jgi:hypothetical protein
VANIATEVETRTIGASIWLRRSPPVGTPT